VNQVVPVVYERLEYEYAIGEVHFYELREDFLEGPSPSRG